MALLRGTLKAIGAIQHTHTETHIQLLDNCCAEQSIKIEVSAVFFIASYTDKTARNAPVSVA